MNDCVSCEIINGSIDSVTILDQGYWIAIMDHHQTVDGNVLVIPKQHVPDIFSLPRDIGADLMESVVRISRGCPKTQ